MIHSRLRKSKSHLARLLGIVLLGIGALLAGKLTLAHAAVNAWSGATVPGAYVAWTVADSAIPPTREPSDPLAPGNQILGVDCITFLGSGGDQGVTPTWDDPDHINWGPLDHCIQTAAARTVKLPDGRTVPQPVVLTLPSIYSQTGSRWYNTAGHDEAGTEDNPLIRLHLPPWMENDTYRFTFQVPTTGHIYQSVRYDGPFKDKLIEFIRAAGLRYDNNPQVSVVRVAAGFAGETQPVASCSNYWDVRPPQGGDGINCDGDTWDRVVQAHETVISCDQFQAFVRDITEAAYAAFPDKPVTVMAGVSPCSDWSGSAYRSYLYGETWSNTPIGVSVNSINTDTQDAGNRPENTYADYAKFTVGKTLSARGAPVVFEYDAHRPDYTRMYWTELSGAANGGDFILHHSNWNGSYTPYFWEVVDYWLASDQRAWIVFRDHEFPTIDYAPGYGQSGAIGDFAKHLVLLNPEAAPQACEPNLRAAAQAANATATALVGVEVTPACPGAPLPAPAITPAPTATPGADTINRLFNYQARRLDASAQMLIGLAPEWPYAGGTYPVTVTVSYLDAGSGSFDVYLPSDPGTAQQRTVTKVGDGLWKRISWTQAGYLANDLDGQAFIKVVNGVADPVYLHEIFVDVGSHPDPLPMPTATPGEPGAAEATATPEEPGAAEATATPTPPASGMLTVSAAGDLPVVDGDTAEWTDLAATVLDTDHAGSITGPIVSPSTLSVSLRSAWTPDTLYFAADIVDQAVGGDSLPGFLENDSLELGLHIPATGRTHQFTITKAGRVTDQGSPISTLTVVTQPIPGGWRAEIAIPAAALGVDTLAVGQAYPFTFGYWDDKFGRHAPAKTHMIWQGTSISAYQPTWGMLALNETQ